MALAEELLDNISEEQAAEYALSELKPHIVVDEDRNIILPERYKKIASQGDHNMETYTFDCPRFSDGRDMSEMVVYINYIRSDGKTGSYPADNVSIDAQNTDLMHFDWTLLLPATFAEGVLAFLVCVCRTGNDGKIENHWSSRMCREAMITEGMDCHKDTIVDLYPDIITRILERLNVLEDGGTNSVQYTIQDLEEEQKAQARKNIGAAAVAEVSKLSEDIATKASAIKEKASGEIIVVTDSDEEKPLGLAIDGKSEQNQYSGKNLLNNTAVDKTVNGLSIKVNEEKKFFVNGTSTVLSAYDVGEFTVKTGETYILTGCPSGGSVSSYRLDVRENANSGLYNNNIIDYGSGCYFTATEDITLKVFMRYDANYTFNNIVFEPMIRLATVTDGTYEPFVGGKPSPSTEYEQEIRNIGAYDEASGKYAVGVKGTGKNLANCSDTENGYPTYSLGTYLSIKKSSVTVTYKNCVKVKKNEQYTVTWNKNTLASENERRSVITNDDSIIVQTISHNPSSEKTTFTAEHDGILYLSMDLNATNIQLELGTVATEYEPYKETAATVYLDEPLRVEDKAYWNGGSKIKVDRYSGVATENDFTEIQPLGTFGRFVIDTLPPLDITKPLKCTKFKGVNFDGRSNYSIYPESGRNVWTCAFKTDSAENSITNATINDIKENIIIEYTLAEPITEEIDIDLGELSMFYPTTILSNDCNANMEVTYIADTKAYIDKKFAELATAMV